MVPNLDAGSGSRYSLSLQLMPRKTAYSTPCTIDADARAWLDILEGYLRHRGPGDLRRAALLIVDLQRYFLEETSPAFLPAAPAIKGNVLRLVAAFRRSGRPVLFTRHADPPGRGGEAMRAWWGRTLDAASPLSALVPELAPRSGEPVIVKAAYSAFDGTELESELAARSVGALAIAGVLTHLCVETTARAAFAKNFPPVVVADATAAPDLDLHLGALRALGHGCARIVRTEEVLQGLGEAAEAVSGLEPAPLVQTRAIADVLVVGCGPAGIAAAIQAHRQRLAVRALDRSGPGGLLRAANRVENYPGFPGGIRGAELAARAVSQASAIGIAFEREEVERIERRSDGTFDASLARGARIEARSVVLATGTRPRELGIPGEAALRGSLVFDRADEVPVGPAARDLLVVGGGDCALDQALSLAERGARVTVLVRSGRTRALSLLVERSKRAGIDLRFDARPVGLRAEDGSLVVSVAAPEGPLELRCGGLLVAVGREPVTPAVGAIPRDRLLREVDAVGRSAVPGLYVAGDCRGGRARQAAIAAGDGLRAAIDALEYLENGRWREAASS